MFAHARSGEVAWFGEQGEGFGSSLEGSGRNATGAVTDLLLRDQDKQRVARVIGVGV